MRIIPSFTRPLQTSGSSSRAFDTAITAVIHQVACSAFQRITALCEWSVSIWVNVRWQRIHGILFMGILLHYARTLQPFYFTFFTYRTLQTTTFPPPTISHTSKAAGKTNKMCYQIIYIFECGHLSNSRMIRCSRPTENCDDIFLRQEVEEICGYCPACQRAVEMRRAQAEAEDEGYWD